jgi:D-alanyl-D-alanine dipeptidase
MTQPLHENALPVPFRADDTDLVLLSDIAPSIQLDVRYATTNNFTGQILYPVAKVYVRRIVARRLAEAQQSFVQSGYSLKLFDGYRPLSVQRKMWAIVPDERYVANPDKGSRHNRAAAVDVSLVRISDGSELDMGTPYDDFTEKAHITYTDLPEHVRKNRALLSDIMQQSGFLPFATEWWHFDFKDWAHFPILDIPIE